MNLPSLGISCEWALTLALWHDIFKVHPYVASIILHSFEWLSNIPLCLSDGILFIHSLADGHLGSFYFLPIVNNTALNIHVQVRNDAVLYHLWRYILISWGSWSRTFQIGGSLSLTRVPS